MAMSNDFLNAMGAQADVLITHLGLVNAGGTELSGGSPAYARIAVTWTAPSNGLVRPDADLDFNIPASTTVGGWRGYSASSGGTDYGGESLTNESFAGQGVYRLLAAQTAIDFDAA